MVFMVRVEFSEGSLDEDIRTSGFRIYHRRRRKAPDEIF